jgi:hypothetical protein
LWLGEWDQYKSPSTSSNGNFMRNAPAQGIKLSPARQSSSALMAGFWLATNALSDLKKEAGHDGPNSAETTDVARSF